MKNKKIFIILFIIVLLIVGAILYIKFHKTNIEKFNEENLIDEAEIILNDKISNAYILFNESNADLDKMSNEKKLVLSSLCLSNFEDYKSNKILKDMRKIFGNKFSIEFKDIYSLNDSKTLVYKYNTKSKKYSKVYDNIGADLIIPLKSELLDQKKEEDTYILSYKQMFYSEFSENNNLVITNIKGEKVYEIKIPENGSINISNDEFNKYKDKLITVDYFFEIEDNQLILKGYELK